MSYKDFLYAKASRNRIPLNGTFELSPVCNFACHMCYVRKTREELRRLGKDEITADQWIDLAHECKDAGMLYLLATGREPFLYPYFPSLYETLHDMGFLISINSNGTLITEETVDWLKMRAPARVNVTLYGASRETYGRLCQNPNGYDCAVRGIKLLCEAGIHVVINGSITPENQDDLEAIISFAHSHSCAANVATYMFPPTRRNAEPEDSRLSPEESGRLNVLKQRYRLGESEFQKAACWMVDRLVPQESDAETWGDDERSEMKCRAGRSACWIAWDGKMTACDMMDFPVATWPFRDGFQVCWEKINNAVRQTSVLAGCRGCELKEICHPCAAMMYAETGDVNKKAPYLCQMSRISEKLWREAAAENGEKSNGF